MDIEVSSNFERLLFELCGRDGKVVSEKMAELANERRFSVSTDQLALARRDFAGHRTDDERCLATIADLWRETGQMIDPHSAAGVDAARAHAADGPVVCLATAHAAKFPDAVERAIGVRPALPPRLADLIGRPERVTRIKNDLAAVKAFVRQHAAGSTKECVA
jgi:threonine synthase